MDKHTLEAPEQGSELYPGPSAQLSSTPCRQAGEAYAVHLARVMQDADHARALLQAHYRALHSGVGDLRCEGDGGSE